MISSFFTKTKPINYLVLLISLLLFYISSFFLLKIEVGNSVIFILFLIALILQVIFVQEIIRTKKTTNITSFAMLFFVLLCMATPKLMNHKELVFCNLFLLLSLNRLLALKDLKYVKQKIFDASLWVCVASIFDPWALFFLGVVFLAVYVYGTKEFRNWLVPFMAIIIFSLLISSFLIVTDNMVFLLEHYNLKLAPSFSDSFIEHFSIKPFLFITAVIGIIILVFIKQGYQGSGRLVHLRLLLAYFLIALAVFFVRTTEANNYTLLLYIFFPAAVFATNFLESSLKKRFKEAVLIACVLIPFVLITIGLVK